jgi:hypothetical protein
VKYEIVELEPFSGSKAKVYSLIPEGEEITMFEKFIDEYKIGFKEEVKDILKRIKLIGHNTGARESFFKPEGDREFQIKYGNFIYALYDEEDKKLRVYCIRFSNAVIILGGGGFKDKSVIKWQDDKILSEAVREIMAYAESIFKQMDAREIFWSKDGDELEGKLKNYENE